MTSKEFVVWMQGFVEACNDYSPTPKQWDRIKDTLANVGDPISFPTFTPNTTPMPLPHYPSPMDNPYKITCTTGSATYNPSSITYGYPSGSSVSYTQALNDYGNWYWTPTSTPQQPTTGSNQLELDFEPK